MRPMRAAPKGGLSPQARGKPSGCRNYAAAHGPIPAGAGETTKMSSCSVLFRAYPRRRGGNIRCACHRQRELGLSPQARGKRTLEVDDHAATGPIPAGAGETTWHGTRLRAHGAYPRRRGGNFDVPALKCCLMGLSPQARGKLRQELKGDALPGPIPAGAGETCRLFGRRTDFWAYPRRRGGNAGTRRRRVPTPGLSPQARGKQCVLL